MKFILPLLLLTSSMAFAEIGRINKDVAIYKPAKKVEKKTASDFIGECKVVAVRELRKRLKTYHGAKLDVDSVDLMQLTDSYFNPDKVYFFLGEGRDERGDVIIEHVGVIKTMKSWRTDESACRL